MGRRTSDIDALPAIKTVLHDDMFYGVRMLAHTLPYYLRHTLILVETADELDFGARRGPEKWIPTMDAFLARWRNGQPALAVMSADTYRELSDRRVPMYKIAEDQRRVIVANFSNATRLGEVSTDGVSAPR